MYSLDRRRKFLFRNVGRPNLDVVAKHAQFVVCVRLYERILHEFNYKIETLEGEPFVVADHITAGDVQVIAAPVA